MYILTYSWCHNNTTNWTWHARFQSCPINETPSNPVGFAQLSPVYVDHVLRSGTRLLDFFEYLNTSIPKRSQREWEYLTNSIHIHTHTKGLWTPYKMACVNIFWMSTWICHGDVNIQNISKAEHLTQNIRIWKRWRFFAKMHHCNTDCSNILLVHVGSNWDLSWGCHFQKDPKGNIWFKT